jgi:hypothetical protein
MRWDRQSDRRVAPLCKAEPTPLYHQQTTPTTAIFAGLQPALNHPQVTLSGEPTSAGKPDTLACRDNSPRLLPGIDILDTEGMITFTITALERQRAQTRAAALDICLTDPPGKYPYVWDNRQNSVKRWYDYESGENKIGTIYFEAVVGTDGMMSSEVNCTTEITYHPAKGHRLHQAKLDDPVEHQWLADLFSAELLASTPTG